MRSSPGLSGKGSDDFPRRKQRRKQGKARRRAIPFERHAQWSPEIGRPDPISVLQAQDEGRLQHLLPIKYGRMAESPLAFLRGSAAIMAADLALTPDRAREFFARYSQRSAASTTRALKKARSRTQHATMRKLTEVVDGRRQLCSDPPLLVRLSDLLSEDQQALMTREYVDKSWDDYVSSVPAERRLLLSRFRPADVALRVGGVGSVGTLCTVLLLEGDAQEDAIILQQKEAGRSVLQAYLPDRGYGSHAQRVVVTQRLIQAASDVFLDWHQSPLTERQYYWRQLKDWPAHTPGLAILPRLPAI